MTGNFGSCVSLLPSAYSAMSLHMCVYFPASPLNTYKRLATSVLHGVEFQFNAPRLCPAEMQVAKPGQHRVRKQALYQLLPSI